MTDNQPLSINQLNTMTTVTILPTDYDEIQRPAPRRGLVEVAKEASTGDTTIEKCLYEALDNNETMSAGVMIRGIMLGLATVYWTLYVGSANG